MHGIQQLSHPLGAGGPNPAQTPALCSQRELVRSVHFQKKETFHPRTLHRGMWESGKQLKEGLLRCLQSTATVRDSWLEAKTSRAPWGTGSVSNTSYCARLHGRGFITEATEPGLHIWCHAFRSSAVWGHCFMCRRVSDIVLSFLPRYQELLFVILYFSLIWLKSILLASNHVSLNGQREAFLGTSGWPQCTENKSSSRYLLKHPAGEKNGSTGLECYFLRLF